jgi:hypothetical protein
MASSTLSIIVNARDEATSTLNRVARSGQQIGTALSTSAGKGTTAINRVNQSSSKFTSTLKKIGSYVGVAFAVTEVVRFGKAAIAAYEGVEKQQSLIEGGLQRIGQAGQLEGLISDLRGVSAETVTLQGNTDQVAAAVLNVGHTYFASLGPQAGKVLAGVTQGILNISAATHKSLGMLQRSLTNSIVNTPDKAIGILNKLGIATAEQAAHWTKLASAGKLVTLRQEEINAVTGAYPGAAKESATASDKLAKAIDDIKIKLGKVLLPIVQVGAAFADLLSKNSALVAGFIALGGAMMLAKTRLGTFIAGLGSARFGIAAFVATLGTMSIIDDLSSHVSESTNKAIENLKAAFSDGKLSAKEFADSLHVSSSIAQGAIHGITFGLAGGALLSNSEVWNALAKNTDGAREAFQSFFADARAGGATFSQLGRAIMSANLPLDAQMGLMDALRAVFPEVAQGAQKLSQKIEKVKNATQVFAGMGKKDFRAWAHDARKAAHDTLLGLGSVEIASHKTARGFLRDSKQMARAAQQQAHAMHDLASKSQDWVPAKYKQWLVDLGPAAVANFEELTHTNQQRAVGDWKSSEGATKKYGDAINKLKTKPIDLVTHATQTLMSNLDNLIQRSPIFIDIYLRQHGKLPGGTGGTPPPPPGHTPGASGSGFGPSFVPVASGGAPIEVGVSIERRRFVDASDYEARYKGF